MGNSQFAHSSGEYRVDSSLSCCDCSRKSKYYEPSRCDKLNDIRIRSQSFARIVDANCSYLNKFVLDPTSSSSQSIPYRSFFSHSNPFSCPSLGGKDGGGGGMNLNYNRLPTPGHTERNTRPDPTEVSQTPSSLSLNGTPGSNYDFHVNPVTMTLRGYEPSNPFNPTNFYNSDPDLSPSDGNSNNQRNPFLNDNPTKELPTKKPKKSKENLKPIKEPKNETSKPSKKPDKETLKKPGKETSREPEKENLKPSKEPQNETTKPSQEPENENVGTNPNPKITKKPSKPGQNQSNQPDPNKTNKTQTPKSKSSLIPNPVQNKKNSDPNSEIPVTPKVQNNENSPSKVPNEEVLKTITPDENEEVTNNIPPDTKLRQNEPNNQTPKNEIPIKGRSPNTNKTEPTPQGKESELPPNENPKLKDEEEGTPVKPPVPACECVCKCSITENDSPQKPGPDYSEEGPTKNPEAPLQVTENPQPNKPIPENLKKQKEEDPNSSSPQNNKNKSSIPESAPKSEKPNDEKPQGKNPSNNPNVDSNKPGVVDPKTEKNVPKIPTPQTISENPKNEVRKPSTDSKSSEPDKNKPETIEKPKTEDRKPSTESKANEPPKNKPENVENPKTEGRKPSTESKPSEKPNEPAKSKPENIEKPKTEVRKPSTESNPSEKPNDPAKNKPENIENPKTEVRKPSTDSKSSEPDKSKPGSIENSKKENRKPSTESKPGDPAKNKPEKKENPNQLQPNRPPGEGTKQNQGTDPLQDPTTNKTGRGIPVKGSTTNKNPQTDSPPLTIVDPVVDKTNGPTKIDQTTEPGPNQNPDSGNSNSRKPSDDSKKTPNKSQKQPPPLQNNQSSGPDAPQNDVKNPNIDEIPTSPVITDNGLYPQNTTENIENEKPSPENPNTSNVVEPNPNDSTGVPENEPQQQAVGPAHTISGPEDGSLPPPTTLETVVDTFPDKTIDSPQNIPDEEKIPSPSTKLEPQEEDPTLNPTPDEQIPDLINFDNVPNSPVDEIQITHPNAIPIEDGSKTTPNDSDTPQMTKHVTFPDSPAQNGDNPSTPDLKTPSPTQIGENPPLSETTTPSDSPDKVNQKPLIPQIASSGSPPTDLDNGPTKLKTVPKNKDKNEPQEPKNSSPDPSAVVKSGGKPSIPKTSLDSPVQGDGKNNVPSVDPQKNPKLSNGDVKSFPKPGDKKKVKRPSTTNSSGEPKEVPIISIPNKSNDKDSPSYHIRVPSITSEDGNKDESNPSPIWKSLNGEGKVFREDSPEPSNRKKRSTSSSSEQPPPSKQQQQQPESSPVQNPKALLPPKSRGPTKSGVPSEKTEIPKIPKQQTKKPSIPLASPRNSLKTPTSSLNLNPSPSTKKLVNKPQGPGNNNAVNKTRRPTTTSNATPSPNINKTKLQRKPMDDNDIDECYEPEPSSMHQQRRRKSPSPGKGKTIRRISPITDEDCQIVTVPRRRKPQTLRNSTRPRSVSTMTCDPIPPSCDDDDDDNYAPNEYRPKKKKAHKISNKDDDDAENPSSKYTDCDDLGPSSFSAYKETRKRVKTAPAKGFIDSCDIDFEKILCDPELMKKLWTKKFKIIPPPNNEKRRCTTSTSEFTNTSKVIPPSSFSSRRRKECQQQQEQEQQYPLPPKSLYQSSFTCIYPSTKGTCPPGTVRNKDGFFVIPKRVKKACKNKSTSTMTCCNNNNEPPQTSKRPTGLELNSSYTNADAGFTHISNQYGPSPYYPSNILPLIHNCGKSKTGKKNKKKTCTSSTSTNGIFINTAPKKSSTRISEKQLKQQKSLCRLNEGLKSLEQLKCELLMRTQLDERHFPNNIQRECMSATTKMGRNVKTCKKPMNTYNINSKQSLSESRPRCKKRNVNNPAADTISSSITNLIHYPSSFQLSLSSRRPFSTTTRLRSSATSFNEYLECYEKIIREIREAEVRKVCSSHSPSSFYNYDNNNNNNTSSRACRGNSCQNVITTTTTTRQQRVIDNCSWLNNNNNNIHLNSCNNWNNNSWNTNSNCSTNNYQCPNNNNNHHQNFLCSQPVSSSLSSPLCGINNNNNNSCCMYSKSQSGNMNMYCDSNPSYCCPSTSIQSERGCNLSSCNSYNNNCCNYNPCNNSCSNNNYGYCIPTSYRVCSVDSLDSNSSFSPNKIASDTNVGKKQEEVMKNKTDLDRTEKEFLHAMGYKTNRSNINLESNRESDYELGIEENNNYNNNNNTPVGRIHSNSSLFNCVQPQVNDPNDIDNIDIPVSDSDPVLDSDVENLLNIISNETIPQYHKYNMLNHNNNETPKFETQTVTSRNNMYNNNHEEISQNSCNSEDTSMERNNTEIREKLKLSETKQENEQSQQEINERKDNAIKSIKHFINTINTSLHIEENPTTLEDETSSTLVSNTTTTTSHTTPKSFELKQNDLGIMNTSKNLPLSSSEKPNDVISHQEKVKNSEKFISSTLLKNNNEPLKSSRSETTANLKSVLKKPSTLNYNTNQINGEIDESSSSTHTKPKKTRSVRFSNPVVQETWISDSENNNNNNEMDFLHDDEINSSQTSHCNNNNNNNNNNKNPEQREKITLEQSFVENEKILPATTSQSNTRIYYGGINNNNKTGNSSTYYASMFGHVGVQRVNELKNTGNSSVITAYHSSSDSNMTPHTNGIRRDIPLSNPQEQYDNNINTNNLFTNSSLDSITINNINNHNNNNNTRRNHHHTFYNCKNFASNFFRLI